MIWKQEKIGKIVDVYDGVHQTPTYTHSGIMFLSVENITTLRSNKFISNEDFNSNYKVFPQVGDILMTRIGDIGTTNVVKTNTKLAYYVSLALLKPINVNSYFLSNSIASPYLQKRLRKRSLLTAIPKKINKDEIGKVNIFITAETEENAVGKFFNEVDTLITLLQRKQKQLEQLKKAMLQKMFPKKDSQVPEIRFDGFRDVWEQRMFLNSIEKIVDFRGRTPKKLGMNWSNEGYIVLSALNVKDGYIDFAADVHYANQELYDKWMVANDLYKGQVIFTTEAPMGNVAQVPDNRKYVLGQRTIAFDIDETKIINNFLAILLRSQNVQHALKSFASGGTAKGISQRSLSQLKVLVPINIKEQQKVGTFFKLLDFLITLNQKKLDHLTQLKKYLLQKMFI